MFKIALDSGHGKYTPGKRCLKSIDKSETREWILNDRICDKVENMLKASYEGYSLIRVDDATGEVDVSLADRVEKADKFGADIYLSVHHNAGINGGSGGGIIAIVYTGASEKSVNYQKIIYDELIKETGLKGNRSTPMPKQNLYVCRETSMPSVLVECGFMDSKTDVPIILTEKFADECATAIVNALASIGNLTKKVPQKPYTKIYKVQVGAYSIKANAEAMAKKLKADGYDAFIV
ncbi:MAG: N-acetylmuramoyl-L-alanine amidase [Ruminococcaceae bacterium]|nr:N-acetylmuramoyl-L-alanine amidase [Oscillospiraceae bacterium]